MPAVCARAGRFLFFFRPLSPVPAHFLALPCLPPSFPAFPVRRLARDARSAALFVYLPRSRSQNEPTAQASASAWLPSGSDYAAFRARSTRRPNQGIIVRRESAWRSLCAARAFLFARGSPAGQASAPARPPRRSPSARQRSPTRKEAPQ